MFDGLTATYRFLCPARGRVTVRLSAFRVVERLPGTSHPSVYRVTFACGCGAEHDGLVTHDALDWEPVAGQKGGPAFYNLLTGKLEPAGVELVEQAALHIRRGQWPWTLYCYEESRPQPLFPSELRLVVPERDGGLVVAARCPACAHTSVIFCSHLHVDVPFFSDRRVGVLEHAFDETEADVTRLAAELADRQYPAALRELAA
jgi:hypothetical protein